MSKIRVVQYINQFFAQIGGEEKADIPAELREGPVGQVLRSTRLGAMRQKLLLP